MKEQDEITGNLTESMAEQRKLHILKCQVTHSKAIHVVAEDHASPHHINDHYNWIIG